MSELKSDKEIVDLHRQPALQEVGVRSGVVLKPMAINDAPAILAILDADPSIRKRVSAAAGMIDTEGVQREIEEYRADPGLIRYMIHSHEKAVGLVSLWRDDGFFGQEAQPHTFGFGYFLDPAERGKGLVTDSVQKLMDTVQGNFRVDSFVAFCEDDNRESVAVLTKLGFAPTEKTFREPSYDWVERKYEKRLGDGAR